MKKLLLLTLFPLAAHAQTNWTNCAMEGGTCNLTSPKSIRYGFAETNSWTPRRSAVGQIPCTNAYFGVDPAQGRGKECQITDVIIFPPPITNPVPYWITYTPPTQNVDGSPIKPIKKIYFQAAPTEDFYPEQTYSWDTATISEVYSVENGPPGVFFWRAFVETDDGMSAATTPVVRTERQYMASRAPKCLPLQEGGDPNLATRMYYDLDLLGGAMYYACKTADNVWQHYGVYGEYKWECISETAKAFGKAILSEKVESLRTVWETCVDAKPLPASLAYRAKWDALKVKYAPAVALPPSQYVVKVNGTLTTRPAFAVTNGIRSNTTIGRVKIGDPCDCTGYKQGEYCSVTGLENVATAAIDKLGSSAAICAAR